MTRISGFGEAKIPRRAAGESLVGERFGRLLVLLEASRGKDGGRQWNCVCDCGNTTISRQANLVRGGAKSCGCVRLERPGNFSHGDARQGKHSSEYQSWCAMIARCTNPNDKGYKNYGARGIVVCARWARFENFLIDMGRRPPGLSIDRINNDGNYEPSNCRWATRTVQARNCRTAKMSESKVRQLKQLRRAGAPYASLAETFSINIGTVTRILSGVTWRGVE